MKRILLSLVSFLLLAAVARANGITVSQTLDKSHLAFEDSAVFQITLQWPGSQFAYRFPQALNPSFSKLQVTRFESSVTSRGTGADEVTLKTFAYTLAPLAPGEGRIEPIAIRYVTYPDSLPGELMTEPMAVQIDQPLPPPEPEAGLPRWIWVVVGVVLMGGIGLGLYLVRGRRAVVVEPPQSPTEAAIERLARLRKDVGDDLKKFQAGLYRILGDYLEERFDIRADALEDVELGDAVRGVDLPPGERERLAEWIVTARKDKFRPVAGTPGATVRMEAEVREVLERIQ